MNYGYKKFEINRIHVLIVVFLFGFSLIALKLFYLQIIRHNHYSLIAQKEHQGYAELPARRGEILITEYHSGDEYKLATNTTLDLVYADPTLVKDPILIAEKLAPLLFDVDNERSIQKKRIESEQKEVLKRWQKEQEEKSLIEAEKKLSQITENTQAPLQLTTAIQDGQASPKTDAAIQAKPVNQSQENALSNSEFAPTPNIPEALLPKIIEKTDEELFSQFKHELAVSLGEKIRTKILLIQEIDPGLSTKIEGLYLPGVEVTEDGNLYAYPPQIAEKKTVARKLASLIGFETDTLERLLQGKNRYIILKKKLEPKISEAIKNLKEKDPQNWNGIKLQEEYYRYYPEGQLASQLLGYVNSAYMGQYGIEGRFQKLLQGEKGYFTSQKDGTGNQITVGESYIKPAKDGDNVYLTIDRAIQLEAEKAIAKGVISTQADSGQIIVMDPKTGKILTMAQYPTFDPNVYGDSYKKKEIKLTSEEIKNLYKVGEGETAKYYLYIRKDPDERIEVFPDKEIRGVWYTYENKVGPEVYKNKTVQEIYEPGSVFKAIAMSAAVDTSELAPNSTHSCLGPIQVDEFEIHTFNDQYHGRETMTQVLEHSCNIGMSFVARTLGRNLFYNYIKKYGFGERTEIELENEEPGFIEYFKQWSESELLTHGFGQGISVTPLQMITAFSALANNGTLMKPYIIDKIENNNTGEIIVTEPKKVEQVVSSQTARTLTSMLTSVIENGIKTARVDGHFVAGKSGTAQTYKNGKALKGVGTTIASFVGFGPIDDPQFIILVKIDRPRTTPWSEGSSVPVFRELADFIFKYYNITPDK